MFLQIDPSNGVAIYQQIVRQMKFAVAGEVIRSAELVPSVRELARQLAINPNTVSRAYRELQADNVLTPVRGTGMMVASGALERCRDERSELIRLRLRLVLTEAKQSRLTPDQLRTLVEEELSSILSEEQ